MDQVLAKDKASSPSTLIGIVYWGAGWSHFISFSCLFRSDPNSFDTLNRFQDALEWASKGSFSDKDVEEAKLAVFSQVSEHVHSKVFGVWGWVGREMWGVP